MRDQLLQTGVTFESGKGLKSTDLNAVNNKVNELVNIVNNMDRKEINYNAEEGEYSVAYHLEDILDTIPESRRKPGVVIRFIEQVNASKVQWSSYYWDAKSPDKWNNLEYWRPYTEDEIIDGGEW